MNIHVDASCTVERPEIWAEMAAATADYTVSPAWLDTMGPLLPGESRWHVTDIDGAPQVGLHLRWLPSPPQELRYNLAAGLRGEMPSPDIRDSTRVIDVRESSLYPSVLAVLPGFSCVPAGSGARDPDALRCALERLDAWARDEGARSVSFLYVPQRQLPLRWALSEFGAIPVDLYPTCVLPVSFDDVEEYLGQLSRRRRADWGRPRRRLAENDMTVAEADLGKVRDEVLELRLNLLRKYGAEADSAAHSAAIDRMLRNYRTDDIVVIATRHGERLVGFTLGLRHGSTLRMLWCGRRPEAYGAYFVMCYYETIRAALRRGVAQIDYGTQKWEVKSAYGCRMESLTGHMWTVAANAR
ncbi:GNAT family N-acetyltransferase [Nocardia sp. NPDC059091]|uniref:GNAT family N-acetyltransferase n=1 Tax=unclassified Nocardia TaxID=2637762 RepID=UPI003694DD46